MTTPENNANGVTYLDAIWKYGNKFSPNTITTASGRVSLVFDRYSHLIKVKDYFGPGQDFQMDIMAGLLQEYDIDRWRFWPDGNFEYYNSNGNIIFKTRDMLTPNGNLVLGTGYLVKIDDSGVKGSRIALNEGGWMEIWGGPGNHLIWRAGPTDFTSSIGLNYGRDKRTPLYSPNLNYKMMLISSVIFNNVIVPNLVITKKNENGQYDPIWTSNNVKPGSGPPWRYRINHQNKLTIVDKNFNELWSIDSYYHPNIPTNIYLKYFLQDDGNLIGITRDTNESYFSSDSYNVTVQPPIGSTINNYWQNYKFDRYLILADSWIWEGYYDKGTSPSLSINDEIVTRHQRKDLGNNWQYLAPQLQDGSFLLIHNDYTLYKAPPGTTIRYVESIGKPKLNDANSSPLNFISITQMVNKRFVAVDTNYFILISDSMDISNTRFGRYRIGYQLIYSIQQLMDSSWIYGKLMNDGKRYSVYIKAPSLFPPMTELLYSSDFAYFKPSQHFTEAINNENGTLVRRFIEINSDQNHVSMGPNLPTTTGGSSTIDSLVNPVTSDFNTGSTTCIIPVYNGYLLNYIFYNKYNVSDSLNNPYSNYLYDNPLPGDLKLPTSNIKYMLTDKELVYKMDGVNIPVESDGISPYLWWMHLSSDMQTFVDTSLDYPVTLDIFKKLWKNQQLGGNNNGTGIILYPDYKYMAVTMPDSSYKLDDLNYLSGYGVYYLFGKTLPPDANLYQGKGGTYGGGINNSTLFTVGRKPDSTVANVKHEGDDWPGTTWKIYDLSIDPF